MTSMSQDTQSMSQDTQSMSQDTQSMKTKEINHYEKYLSGIVSIIGIYSSLTHNYEDKTLIIFIMYYLFDLKKKTITMEFIINHFFVICVSLLGLYIKYNNFPSSQNRQMLLHMEITTPIYILSVYIDNVYTKLLFFISFFYCRIYTQYMLLNDRETYNEFTSMPIKYPLYIVYSGLYALNLYWFMIMIKKISKPFKDPKYIFCHKLIPFIQPLKLNLLNFYSTISTYLYHEDIYTAIMNDTPMENYVSPQTMVHSIVNSVVSISSIEPRYYKYSIAIHACKLVDPNLDIIAIGVDTCFYYSTDALIVYYIYILVRIMKPFYHLNPLALHVLLLLLRQV
jgi:hypothetical protein